MKHSVLIGVLTLLYSSLWAQYPCSPAFYGPNANPVHDFSSARIPKHFEFSVSSEYYFGFGDRTGSLKWDLECPLISEAVSLRLWMTALEFFDVEPAVLEKRGLDSSRSKGSAVGDVYVQTRIRLLKETPRRPAIVLSIVLKSASGGKSDHRRFFDTPGYYFDLEIGKSFYFKNDVLSEIRLAGDIGFLCWQTHTQLQNDAPMYGAKLSLANAYVRLDNSIGGYLGWIGDGDAPLVFRTCLTAFPHPLWDVFFQYQYGITDFPYHGCSLGVRARIPILTPRFKTN